MTVVALVIAFILETLKLFLNVRVWLIAAVLFGVGFCKGDASRDRKWRAEIAEEKAAQEKITRQADEDAALELDRWLAEQERIDALNADLDKEAIADPVAQRGSMSNAGVLRINRARAGRSQ